MQIVGDGGDGVDRSYRFRGKPLFHQPQVILDKVEKLAHRDGLTQLAQIHVSSPV
jgi:hypothetical protein